MKSKSIIKITRLWTISIAFWTCPLVWADTAAFTSGGYKTNQPPSFTGTKGWGVHNFVVSNYMAITQLGVFDNGGDGLANSHAVGVWTVDGTLLASTTIPAGTTAPLVDGYRYMPIAPVLIPPGFHAENIFIIGTAYSAGDADDLVTPLGASFANGVSLWNFATGFNTFGSIGHGTGLPFPGFYYSVSSDPQTPFSPPFLELNFQFQAVPAPEPAVPLLLAPGLFWLYTCRRKLVEGIEAVASAMKTYPAILAVLMASALTAAAQGVIHLGQGDSYLFSQPHLDRSQVDEAGVTVINVQLGFTNDLFSDRKETDTPCVGIGLGGEVRVRMLMV